MGGNKDGCSSRQRTSGDDSVVMESLIHRVSEREEGGLSTDFVDWHYDVAYFDVRLLRFNYVYLC